MACVNGDGTLTIVARQMLAALATADGADDVRVATGLPMYRVRSGLREMVAAGLVEVVGETRYLLTERGRRMITV
jgi:DNA-binding IclR family transcriptional regulator